MNLTVHVRFCRQVGQVTVRLSLTQCRVCLKVSIAFADLAANQNFASQTTLMGALGLYCGVATQIAPKSAISDYAKRWSIETLFGIFKTREFCLESTHLTDGERLSKLLALLSLALCWVILTGEWLHRIKPLTIKKHGRRAKSIFRYGFDYLRHIVLNLEQKMDDFQEVLKFCPDT